jgi:hypothetical protein
MLVVFLALFGVLRASLVLATLAKAKAAGAEVAISQMEYLRGLSYDSLGTVGGIPAGAVPQTATTTVDGIPYATRTYIEYYDSPADGLGVADTNTVTTDYKIAKVTVSYSINGLAKSIDLVSTFVPPGLESSTGGGTLSLHIVGATGNDIDNATVQIVNAATSPSVNLTTFSDATGIVLIGGAATSSEYQIYVTKAGYSSAETYARTGANVNPTPGYLTVAKDQTTNATFAIDALATLAMHSFAPASTVAFTDSFTTSTNLASQTNTEVSGGSLVLVSEALSGGALSSVITPPSLTGWGVLSADLSQPSGTTATVYVNDASGTRLPDTVLPGNSSGFSTFPVFLTGVATTSYPSLSLEAALTSNATTTTSAILDWSLSYSLAPAPSANLAFTLTGVKTIGTDGGGQPIYKTILATTTGASGSRTLSLEWDAYTLSGVSPIESCPSGPYALAPSQASSTALLVGSLGTNTLPITIEDTTNNPIPGAKVILASATEAATVLTSQCGLAFFNNLSADTYSATVSAAGHATTTFTGIVVSGQEAATTFTLP